MESFSKPLYSAVVGETVVEAEPGHVDGVGGEDEQDIVEVGYPADYYVEYGQHKRER